VAGVLVSASTEPQQEVDIHGLWELGCAAEASVFGIEMDAYVCKRLVQEVLRNGVRRRPELRADPEVIDEAGTLRVDFRASLTPRLSYGLQHSGERRHAVALFGWEVRAAVERRSLRRQKNGHRPAAVTRHRLNGLHVERIDVGPLFPVDLYRYEVVVHQPGGLRAFEGFVLHDVAPVAGRVTDR
jgi:hypothetical protein